MGKKAWWSEGIRFECQGSGKCCVSHGEYGFVFLTEADLANLARELKMSVEDFARAHCEHVDDQWRLKDGEAGDCRFLKDRRCEVYAGRPVQCRTWPFWPEVMNARAWKKDVADFCPGVGKGRVWTAQDIQARLDENKEN